MDNIVVQAARQALRNASFIVGVPVIWLIGLWEVGVLLQALESPYAPMLFSAVSQACQLAKEYALNLTVLAFVLSTIRLPYQLDESR